MAPPRPAFPAGYRWPNSYRVAWTRTPPRPTGARRSRSAACSPHTTAVCNAVAPVPEMTPRPRSRRPAGTPRTAARSRKHDNYAGPRLAVGQLRRSGTRGRPRGRRLGGRPATRGVPRSAPGSRGPALRDRLRAGQPDPGCVALLRGRGRAADRGRDGQWLPVPDVHLGRLLVRRTGGPQL